MTFEDFTRYVEERLPDYLPEEYRSLHTVHVSRIGAEYTALFSDHENGSPGIDLERFYGLYGEDMAEEEMFRRMASVITHEGKDIPDTGWLGEYGKVRDKLFIRVCNALANAAYLRTAPHILFEDLALTCHALVDVPGHSELFASVTVRHHMLENYGISEEQLFADAFTNSQRILPGKVGYLSESVGEPLTCAVGNDPFLIVTNSRNVDGASVLFYPGMTEKIAEETGTDYYVLPSSIHEVLIVPDTGIDPGELERLVQEVNRKVVNPAERLSDHVYRYDRERAVLERTGQSA